jgi:hypothetical protein
MKILDKLARKAPAGKSSEPKSRTVYRAYVAGRPPHTIICSPGLDYPDVDEFHLEAVISGMVGGGTERKPRSIPVRFVDGQAEVDERIAEHLLKAGLAHKKPQAALPVAGGAPPSDPRARAEQELASAIARSRG